MTASSTKTNCRNITRPLWLIGLAGVATLLIVVLLAGPVQSVSATSLVEQLEQASVKSGAPSSTVVLVENPELTARVLEDLIRSIVFSANVEMAANQGQSTQKRGLDLGISRGFSGSQAGKHLMGLSAASFANGPGRR